MKALVAMVAIAALGGGVATISQVTMDRATAEPARTGHRQEIVSVSLDGRGLPMSSLRELLTSHAGEAIDTAKLAHDRDALQAELEARGYLAAKVQPAKITYDEGAFALFAIEQGPLFRVRGVTISGATEKDAGVVTIGVGEIATADRIKLARTALAERLSVRNKPVTVDANVHPDLTAAVVDIELAVH
ncbi:MAG TPA: POTRA domain-containing protein [Kofleriaceae bacterium]|nr:POTRA domain-containing protein [Kofleriaceae bacterium]